MRKKRFFRRAVYEYPDRLFVPERNPKKFRKWLSDQIENRPLEVELGMGTGDFLITQALKRPDTFFLGVEIKPDRIYRAMEKAEQLGVENISFLQTPVEKLDEYDFPNIEKLYLFFSDPWPKDKHAERRMTSASFLRQYRQVLPKGKILCIKTDNRALFDFSLESLKSQSWKMMMEDKDYRTAKEFQTAFEKKFLKNHQNIYYTEHLSPGAPFSFRKFFAGLVNSFSPL